MNSTPLHAALTWWMARDERGGFLAVAAELFPGWIPKACCRAPHRPDRIPSFSIYRSGRGGYRFKDHATGEGGGLVDFVMLAGMDARAACRWLMEKGSHDESRRERRPAGAVDLDRPRHTHDPRMIANCESQPQPDGCGRLGAIAPTSPAWTPYCMSPVESSRHAAMASALYNNHAAIARIAAARGWKPETIRALALGQSLGVHEGHPVMLYPTGAKKRLKPLPPAHAGECNGAKFLWMYGKPHSLWRGHLLRDCTQRIHITEGETAALSLIDEGIGDDMAEIVVAVPGASSWLHDWAGAFRGKSITLWPDADAAGARLQERIVASLTPFARSIETVTAR